ncbi:hypothetical protein ONZ45_g1644 [Pleurotus djamor]|nr:hypothetical protein ONZ45_g1644 [Pleurotus djamor]
MTDPNVVGTRKWSGHMLEIYATRKGPVPLGTVSPKEIEEKAKEARKEYPGSFWYAGGSAGTNSTCKANLNYFEKFHIVPRMLVDATNRSLETTLFGVKYPAPLLLAPIGVQGICHADGELGSARAASKLGVPFIMSSASSRTIEATAEASGSGPRWYQLYWPRSNDVTLSLLSRAKANGFTALVVTLDTFVLGWRPHDLENSYLPFYHGLGVQVGTSDPVFMARYNRQPNTEIPEFPYDPAKIDAAAAAGDAKVKDAIFLGMEYLKETNSGLFRTWEDLKFLRDNWEGPIVLKGIQSVGDAEKAIEHGMDGIIVSNHGGRQIDGAIPSLFALENIMKSTKVLSAQGAGKFTVLFDSGIRTGGDIIKALALGAQAVLLGRPYLYGLMIAGQAGVEQVVKDILADMDTSMGLAGYTSVEQIIGEKDKVAVKLVHLFATIILPLHRRNFREMVKLTPEQLEEHRAVFDSFDRDSSGSISKEELGTVMRALGHNPSEDDLRRMIREVDNDRNGTIEFDEFIELMTRAMVDPDKELMDAFRAFDQNGDGFVTAEELARIMAVIGEPLNEHEIRAMIAESDIDKDGRVNFEGEAGFPRYLANSLG